MSSNLLKRGYTNVNQDEKRVIDTNELVERRIRELSVQMQRPENAGFVSGLEAPAVDVEALLTDDAEESASQGNVIKAKDESEKILQAKDEASRLLAEARKDADALVEQARQHVTQLEKDARVRMEQERMQLLEQARQQGMQEGMEQAAREAESARRELEASKKQMEEEYDRLVEELEPKFVDTITGIYEHIFHVELRSYREVLSYLISNTMRKIEGNRTFLIHVSKEDYPYISMQKKQIAAGATAPNSSVEVVEDITLSKNECLIETDGGIFDCGLGTQLTELRQKLKLLSYEKQ